MLLRVVFIPYCMHSFYLVLEDVNRCKTLLHPRGHLLHMDWKTLIEISNCVVKAVGYMKNRLYEEHS